jgi:hypothetical protein
MSMKEDRAREGKKAQYRKMGFGPAMDRGDIDFGDKHPLTKKRLKNFKKKENPMADERFYQTAKKRLMDSGISAKEIGKYNDTPNKFDASRIAKKAGGGMSAGQAKLAAKAPPPNKIDAKDFAVLRAEKAKGRGMGLQDEKVKPGKVMKAKVGKSIDAKKFMKTIGVFPKVSSGAGGKGSGTGGRFSKIPLAGKATSVGSTTMKGMKFSDKAKMVDAGKINKATGKFTSMEALRESIGYRPGESTDNFNKRRMALAAAKKAAKATTIGKIFLPIATAGVAAQQYLKSKMNKKKDVKKKMGGGMMKKPMGYVTGGGMDAGGPKGRLMAYAKENMIKDKDRLTLRDKAMIKEVKNMDKSAYPAYERYYKKLTSTKKMGGGMMKKPMGYKHGTYAGKGPLGGSALPPAGRPASQEQNKKKGPGLIVMMPVKEGPANQNTTIKTVKVKNRDELKKTLSSRMSGGMMKKYSKGGAMKKGYMGGGMMKPMGYKSGTMVKARGCKLGRTRPTKIT